MGSWQEELADLICFEMADGAVCGVEGVRFDDEQLAYVKQALLDAIQATVNRLTTKVEAVADEA